MAHLVLGVLGHHYTQQAAVAVGKRVGKFALEQGYNYATKRITSSVNRVTENAKRQAASFQEIDTVPLKRRNVPCKTEDDCADDGYYDYSQSQLLLTYVWLTAANQIFNPVLGDDIGNRRGRLVRVSRIFVRVMFYIRHQNIEYATGTHTNPAVRYILFVDKFANGTRAFGNDVFGTTGTESLEVFTNLAHNNRFFVLTDKVFNMNPSISYDSTNTRFRCSPYTVYKDIDLTTDFYVQFNSLSTSDFTSVLSNSIYFAAIQGPQATADASFPVYHSYSVRVTFENMSKY